MSTWYHRRFGICRCSGGGSAFPWAAGGMPAQNMKPEVIKCWINCLYQEILSFCVEGSMGYGDLKARLARLESYQCGWCWIGLTFQWPQDRVTWFLAKMGDVWILKDRFLVSQTIYHIIFISPLRRLFGTCAGQWLVSIREVELI